MPVRNLVLLVKRDERQRLVAAGYGHQGVEVCARVRVRSDIPEGFGARCLAGQVHEGRRVRKELDHPLPRAVAEASGAHVVDVQEIGPVDWQLVSMVEEEVALADHANLLAPVGEEPEVERSRRTGGEALGKGDHRRHAGGVVVSAVHVLSSPFAIHHHDDTVQEVAGREHLERVQKEPVPAERADQEYEREASLDHERGDE